MAKDCKKFKIDDLSQQLGGALPTSLASLPKGQKQFAIDEAFSNALSNITSTVANAVDNFKNIVTGGLPEFNKPEIDPTKVFDKITSEVSSTISEFQGLRAGKFKQRLDAQALLDGQLDCIETDVLKSDETASLEGNMLGNISKSIGNISPTNLRDFNLPGSNLQLDFVNNITSNTVDIQKSLALQGTTFKEKAASQANTLNSFGSRKPITLDVKAIDIDISI